jgi:diguanylate cyclase (GGDEF)-like protein
MKSVKDRLQQLRHLLAVLNPAAPADERRSHLLKPILQVALVLIVLLGPAWTIFSPAVEHNYALALMLVAVISVVALIAASKRGFSQAAAIGFPAAMLAVYTLGLFGLGGVRSPLVSGFFMIVVVAHVLLGERGAAVFAGFSIAALVGVYVAETQGLITYSPASASRAWIFHTGQLAFLARLLYLTLQPVREGLATARHAHTREIERARELDALLQAHSALVSTLDLDPLLNNILQAALGAIPAAEKGAVLLTGPTPDSLQVRALQGYADPRIQNLAFVGTSGYSARALRDRRAWRIDDVHADAEVRYDGEIGEMRDIRSAICVPLLLQNEPVGVIALDATRPAAFTESDLRLLVAFANTAAIAISNAHLHAEIQAMANRDGLTGAANRRMLDASLAIEVDRAQRYGHPVSLIFMDLDSFKIYNDTFGHPAGDDRLQATAAMLRGLTRYPDVLARYGGEEFALLLPHTDKAGALALAERVRATAQGEAGVASGFVPGYTLSLGVAEFPRDALTPEGLLRAADEAELAAKRAGKNRVKGAPTLATERAAAGRPTAYETSGLLKSSGTDE